MSNGENIFKLDNIIEKLKKGTETDTQNQLPQLQQLQKLPNKNVYSHARQRSSNKTREIQPLPTSLLANYFEVPHSDWRELPINAYIKYINKNDGKLKAGGKILNITTDNANKLVLTLGKYNKITKQFIKWVIKEPNIMAIYLYKNQNQLKPNDLDDDLYMPYNPEMDPNINNNIYSEDIKSPEDNLSLLGDKLLFNDKDTIMNRLEAVEIKTQKLEDDLKKIFMLVKRLYDKILNK